MISLDDDLRAVITVRGRMSSLNNLGIHTVNDLLTDFPRKVKPAPIYASQYSDISKIDKAALKEKKVLTCGILKSVRQYPPFGKMRVGRFVLCAVDKNGNTIDLVYFAKSLRYLEWLAHKYNIDDTVIISGTPSKNYNKRSTSLWQFSHPEIIVSSATTVATDIEQYQKPLPIYAASAKISSSRIHDTIMTLLNNPGLNVQDVIPTSQLAAQGRLNPLVGNMFWGIALENEKVSHSSQSAKASQTVKSAEVTKSARYQALYEVHSPQTIERYDQAIEYLRFEEALVLQSMLRLSAMANKLNAAVKIPRLKSKSALVNLLPEQLPWRLTNAQTNALAVISSELNSATPMHRMLQGDVGSGKTVVALSAMLQVVDSGLQAVLLAPTQVLANQHFDVITKLLGDLYAPVIRNQEHKQVRVELLTGDLPASEQKRLKSELKSGEIDILVGTHSVLYRENDYKSLGLVVVDEQHRFGVKQRNLLRENREFTPHILYMSATPIPRSIAYTYFADLDITSLNELPSGRGDVETFIIESDNEKYVNRMWERVAEEVTAGHNIFIVTPHIDSKDLLEDDNPSPSSSLRAPQERGNPISDSNWIATPANLSGLPRPDGARNDGNDDKTEDEDIDTELIEDLPFTIFQKLLNNGLDEIITKKTRSIASLRRELKKIDAVKDIPIGILHGRVDAKQKSKIMDDFINLRTPILLATTVIEVGIDVPNASVMLICDADKFSLSTLHQLRGRIGRGKTPGICFLLTSKDGVTENGEKRLQIIAETRDGFKIANEDLNIRGFGDISTAKQSGGRSGIKLIDIIEHVDIIEAAKVLSEQIIGEDSSLTKYPELLRSVNYEHSDLERDFVARG